jgi:stress response protein SCP2
MKNLNRDLLVITKKIGLDRNELEQTIIGLNTVLFQAESLTSICVANEVFDLNKYKKYTSKKDVAFYIENKSNKPFIFISSKN